MQSPQKVTPESPAPLLAINCWYGQKLEEKQAEPSAAAAAIKADQMEAPQAPPPPQPPVIAEEEDDYFTPEVDRTPSLVATPALPPDAASGGAPGSGAVQGTSNGPETVIYSRCGWCGCYGRG
jgi:hypothetical protein